MSRRDMIERVAGCWTMTDQMDSALISGNPFRGKASINSGFAT